ncbi:MAG: methionyl-tRNA formyltransferase [Anaerolineales bacterium]|nr:methionyl-tRNA formyltransferase [Anaerolineales bacterium]
MPSLQTTRVVFMGTPQFAVPSLRALLEHARVVGVATQPDRPAGRGQQLGESPVKQVAQAAGVPVIQPEKLREPEALAQLKAWQPDLIVVAAFGQILKPAVLDLPPFGCLNVHASLLPRWRGAAPVAAAIAAGDSETGVTLMRMDTGLDTGPLLAKSIEPIQPDDTTGTLTARLAQRGADLLLAALPTYLAGELEPQPQDEALATYAPQLRREDGHLDFTRSAVELERRVRALTPWPGAFALWQGRPLKVLRAAPAEGVRGEPGEVLPLASGVAVACGDGALRLLEVQPAGKRAMPADDFARGARGFIGSRLE